MSSKRIVPIFIPHLGCPHNCIFCNQNTISGADSFVKLENIQKEIEKYISYFKKPEHLEIAYFGGSFTNLEKNFQKELLDLANIYIEKGFVDHIRISTRPDSISKEILDFLYENNVRIIELGVQSLNDKVLKISRRGHSVEDTLHATNLIKEHGGFTLGYQLLPGLPGEEFQNIFDYSIKIAEELKPDIMRIYPLVIFKDTALANLYLQGRFKPFIGIDMLNLISWMKIYFTKHNIKIIRLGLHGMDGLFDESNVLGGAMNYSYNTLVNTRIYNYILKRLNTTDILEFNPRHYEFIIGYKGINKKFFNIKKENLKTNNQIDEFSVRDCSGKVVDWYEVLDDIKADVLNISKHKESTKY